MTETQPAHDFDDVYDQLTLDMIDAQGGAPRHPGSLAPVGARQRFRRGAAGAALATALVTGVRESLEPESEEVLEEIDNGIVGGVDRFVSLVFVPNDPHATRAIVRPWLAPSAVANPDLEVPA